VKDKVPSVSVITIDGPVASGKTSVGRRVAQALNFRFLDTGVLYRAVALAAHAHGLDIHDASVLVELAHALKVNVQADTQNRDVILIDGVDVTDALRSSVVEQSVALVSSYPELRLELIDRQREFAAPGKVVMVGRDIGTTILPHADLKIFLQASPGERARRRVQDFSSNGLSHTREQVLQDLHQRDSQDSGRSTSPLLQPDDAYAIDTEEIGLDEVVRQILKLCGEGG